MEGKKEQSLQEKMEQSEEEFKQQFNPTHPHYHGGIQTHVPLNGERIPESMPSMYPQGYDPNSVSTPVDYGEEYAKVQKDRCVYQDLKKCLAKLALIVESFLRHEDIFKQKGNPNNEKHLKSYQENILKEETALKEVQQELATYLPCLDGIDIEGRQIAKELVELITQSGKKHDNKQLLGQFNFKNKKLSTRAFAAAQKCLQRLKEIKKTHTSQKEQI